LESALDGDTIVSSLIWKILTPETPALLVQETLIISGVCDPGIVA